METGTIIAIIVSVLVIGSLVALYFFSKKMQKKQAEQEEVMKASAQTLSLSSGILIKKQSKVPVEKAKVRPRVMTLICDDKIFPIIPVKKEVKAVISGMYITDVKGLRGALETPQKKGFFARFKKNK